MSVSKERLNLMVSGYCHQNTCSLSPYGLFKQIPGGIIQLCFEYLYLFEGDFKCIFLGEKRVGKTSIIRRFVNGTFGKDPSCTIGSNYFKKSLEMYQCKINYELWDLYLGRLPLPSPMHFRSANIAIAVFDVTSQDSFVRLKFWIEHCKQETNRYGTLIAIAANKCDLKQSYQVNLEEVRAYAKEQESVLFEISAKQNINITEMFEELGQMAADKYINGAYASHWKEKNLFGLDEESEENSSMYSCWW